MSFYRSNISFTNRIRFLFYCRGPEHHLLEHPDKDGNLPLMHACAKLDIRLVNRSFYLYVNQSNYASYSKVELLIRAGANVNNYIGSGKTAYVFCFFIHEIIIF